MFLPTTKEELSKLGWKKLDVILISGDTYIDSSYSGAAVIGKVLLDAGYKVGIIAQPDFKSDKDIKRLGEPELFWGVTSGCVDSMVANFTASKKRRRQDDFTPGGENNRRPDRAVIIYSNLIRQYFKNTKPIVIGGIEASLRRIAHYDYWDDKIRRSILFDAKADILVYGMGEKQILEIAKRLRSNKPFEDLTRLEDIRGICYISKTTKEGYLHLPSFDQVIDDKNQFIKMFHTFYQNNDSVTAKGLCQLHSDRYLIQTPSAGNLTQEEIDKIYNLDFERDVHPFYKKDGNVRAMDTIRFSITTHRGCYGECNFCAISVHQGTAITSRSEKSILKEANEIVHDPGFKGYIQDVGGPTANMYATGCDKMQTHGICLKKDCVFPTTCKNLDNNHRPQIELLRKLRKIEGVKKVFVASGIRYDMILDDKEYGEEYLQELIEHHVSGQLKIAPEHTGDKVLGLMRKPGTRYLTEFKKRFDEIDRRITSRRLQKGHRSKPSGGSQSQFLTYYLIAAHPGATLEDEVKMKQFVSKELHTNPEQVQIFTPTPSTYSTLMYYTEMNPWTGEQLFVEKNLGEKNKRKKIITNKL
ncbi:MAG: YgiQ family radical SAM protein [Ignavibacteriales bacterium]|nr:YgiQ family radical SAM protein [Ignavibacteriales bacterium]